MIQGKPENVDSIQGKYKNVPCINCGRPSCNGVDCFYEDDKPEVKVEIAEEIVNRFMADGRIYNEGFSEIIDAIAKALLAAKAEGIEIGIEASANIFDISAESFLERARKADTAMSVSVWTNAAEHDKQIAKAIRKLKGSKEG